MRRIARFVALLSIAVLLLVSCVAEEDHGGLVPIHTNLQAWAMDQVYYALPVPKIKGYSELSRPRNYELFVGNPLLDGVVVLSEDGGVTYPLSFEVEYGTAYICNLKLGTEYLWKFLDGGEETGLTGQFMTEATPPRNLYISGVTNARDLGGWKTMDGGRIRQGLLYRTGRITQNETGEQKISDKGIAVMNDVLGVKTEVDFRKTSNGENGYITESILGPGVTYCSLPIGSMYELSDDSFGTIRGFFSILADEDNYPVFFHCSIGTDRTGVAAILVEALLGVDEEDIYRDYLFSNFGNIGGTRRTSNIDGTLAILQSYPGSTLSEKTEAFLLKAGVGPEEIESVRNILLETR